jgi:hypothetical protein
MLKALIVLIVLGLGVWAISQMLPDMQRYMRLRAM